MRKYLFSLLLFLQITTQAQQTFNIEGFGKSFKEGDSIFLSYKQGDVLIDRVTTVKNGSFSFRGNFKERSRGYVSRNDNPKTSEFLYDSYDVYIEAGDIRLESPDSLKNSIISGTPLNNDYAVLMRMLKPVTAYRKTLTDPDDLTPEQKKDSLFVNQVKSKYYAALDAAIPVQFDFINKYPGSYISLLQLARLAKTTKLLPQVEISYQKLSKELQAMPEGKDVASRIAAAKVVIVGMQAKDFSQPDKNGKPVKLSDYRGKYVLVDFWASWCLPCREENPNVIAAYNKYKDKGFTVLGVSIDVQKDRDNWLKAVQDDKLPWTNVSDLKKENAAYTLYGIRTIPANVLIDPSGRVIAKDLKREALWDFLKGIFGE